MYIIYYSNRSYIQNIAPDFRVRKCDIALAGSGYIRSEDTNIRSYILYIHVGPVRIIYSIMVTSLTQTNYYCNNSFTTYVFAHAHFGLQNAVFCFIISIIRSLCIFVLILFIYSSSLCTVVSCWSIYPFTAL